MRASENPIITAAMVQPSRPDFEVVGVFNPGVTRHGSDVLLLLRVAEAPVRSTRGEVAAAVYNIALGLSRGAAVACGRQRPRRHRPANDRRRWTNMAHLDLASARRALVRRHSLRGGAGARIVAGHCLRIFWDRRSTDHLSGRHALDQLHRRVPTRDFDCAGVNAGLPNVRAARDHLSASQSRRDDLSRADRRSLCRAAPADAARDSESRQSGSAGRPT